MPVATDMSALVPLFAQNYHDAKKGVRWWNDSIPCRLGAAFLHATDGDVLDPAQIKGLARMVRKESSRFSYGVSMVLAARAAAFSDSPEAAHLMKVAWDVLKVRPFTPCPRLSVASLVLAECAMLDDFGLVAERARGFYQAQRADHSVITSADDYVPSLLLAFTPLEVPTGAVLVEQVYQTVKPWFGFNESQVLAQVVVASGASEVDPTRLLALRNALGRGGVKISEAGGVSALGLLMVVSSDHDWVARSVAQVSSDLKASKVLSGAFEKALRNTLAMFLVAAAVGDEAQASLARALFLNDVARAA
jgi:hypothetical protein